MIGDLLKINNQVVTKFVKYEILYAKLWAEDSGRNMAGVMEGTMIGIFPKLQITVGKLNENEISSLIAILNAPYMSVTYYDIETKTSRTAQYYAGDITPSMIKKSISRYGEFSFNLIPVRAR